MQSILQSELFHKPLTQLFRKKVGLEQREYNNLEINDFFIS
jgi:hypothetical protein